MAATPEGAAPVAAAPHGNPIAVDGVGGLHSGGVLGSDPSRPGEGGKVEGDGLSETSDSGGDARWREKVGYSEPLARFDSDGGAPVQKDIFQDGV